MWPKVQYQWSRIPAAKVKWSRTLPKSRFRRLAKVKWWKMTWTHCITPGLVAGIRCICRADVNHSIVATARAITRPDHLRVRHEYSISLRQPCKPRSNSFASLFMFVSTICMHCQHHVHVCAFVILSAWVFAAIWVWQKQLALAAFLTNWLCDDFLDNLTLGGTVAHCICGNCLILTLCIIWLWQHHRTTALNKRLRLLDPMMLPKSNGGCYKCRKLYLDLKVCVCTVVSNWLSIHVLLSNGQVV